MIGRNPRNSSLPTVRRKMHHRPPSKIGFVLSLFAFLHVSHFDPRPLILHLIVIDWIIVLEKGNSGPATPLIRRPAAHCRYIRSPLPLSRSKPSFQRRLNRSQRLRKKCPRITRITRIGLSFIRVICVIRGPNPLSSSTPRLAGGHGGGRRGFARRNSGGSSRSGRAPREAPRCRRRGGCRWGA